MKKYLKPQIVVIAMFDVDCLTESYDLLYDDNELTPIKFGD